MIPESLTATDRQTRWENAVFCVICGILFEPAVDFSGTGVKESDRCPNIVTLIDKVEIFCIQIS
jgi:hypothetical protein